MTNSTGDAPRAASPGPRALLASLTDEEAEAVVTLAQWAATEIYPVNSTTRSAIAKLRGEGA